MFYFLKFCGPSGWWLHVDCTIGLKTIFQINKLLISFWQFLVWCVCNLGYGMIHCLQVIVSWCVDVGIPCVLAVRCLVNQNELLFFRHCKLSETKKNQLSNNLSVLGSCVHRKIYLPLSWCSTYICHTLQAQLPHNAFTNADASFGCTYCIFIKWLSTSLTKNS